MEKQPIDDLFARKLRDAEAPVGPDIFDQLQKRMSTKPLPTRRLVVAWWHVVSAACVLVAFWFMYITNSTPVKVNAPVAYKELLSKTAKPEAVQREVAVAPALKLQKQLNANTDKVSKNVKLLTKATYPARKPVAPARQSIANESTPMRLQPQPIEQITGVRSAAVQQTPEIQPVAMNSTLPVERIANSPKQQVGRTVVLTIDEAQLATTPTTTQSDSPAPQQQHQNGLSGLLGKLKQLKNGEVLAKAAPTAGTQNSPKNRLGRVFFEVKESLKNETTLE